MLFLIRPSLLPWILQIRGIMYCNKLMQVSIDSEINCAFFKQTSFLVSWARTVLKCLLVSWYTHLIKETIHLATEFFEPGLQTPFWYVTSSPYGLFFPKVALTTENEACILREVTDGLLRREIWIQANASESTFRCPMSCSDNFSYGRSIKQGPRSGKFSCIMSTHCT
jgi:hypothetical protein